MINNFIDYNSIDVDGLYAPARVIKLLFNPNNSTQRLLGFKDNIYTRLTNIGVFTAELALDDLYIPGSILVEIPTLTLNSFDFRDGFNSRRNILACLPNLEKNGLTMTYKTDRPLLVDIRNKYEQVINLIKI